jgi:hypothetical protein
MSHRTGVFLVVGVLVLLALSCAKLPEQTTPPQKSVEAVKLPDENTIPSDWGNLVSVSSPEYSQPWMQLWFQDEKGTIRMVPYSIETNQFNLNSRMIPRK